MFSLKPPLKRCLTFDTAQIDRVGRRDLTFYGMIVLTLILLVEGGLACVTGNISATRGTVALVLVYCW